MTSTEPKRHPWNNLTEGKDEWLTPPEILKALGDFDLDPCAPIVRPWPTAKEHFTRLDNGLRKEWKGRVWLNPPYGRELRKWMGRMAEHGNGTALILARTDTSTFTQYVWPRASAILFIAGRIKFHKVDGSRSGYDIGAPACLVAYGDNDAWNLRCAHMDGDIKGQLFFLNQ